MIKGICCNKTQWFNKDGSSMVHVRSKLGL